MTATISNALPELLPQVGSIDPRGCSYAILPHLFGFLFADL